MEIVSFARWEYKDNRFSQKLAQDLHKVLHGVLHRFSTKMGVLMNLAIDFFLDFFDLVAKGEIKLEIIIDFLDTMHDGGMVFDTDFASDFIGAKSEFFR